MTAFIAKQLTRSYVQQIDFPPDVVFPLLCPVREAEWLDGWDYELIYSASGYAEKNCVFKSKHVGEPDTIWLITEHDTENHRVGFARVTPFVAGGESGDRLTGECGWHDECRGHLRGDSIESRG